MSMPRAAAANGLAKILNESKDPVLFSCRHVAAAVQFLSQSSSVAAAGGIGKSDPVETDGPGWTRCAETVRTSTTGDIRKRGREEKTRQKVRDRSARGENTRIRCVKSIKGYPFNPAMSEIHCCEKVQEALTLLKEELKGTYYTLGALDKQIRQQLLDDHFLFNEGKDKQFLKAANQISTNE